MYSKLAVIPICLILVISCIQPQHDKQQHNAVIEDLLKQMTLREKLGQMNQYSSGTNLTGPAGREDGRYQKFIDGEVGSVLNLNGAVEAYKLQKLVVDSTRLGIPLIFSFDVIHGYKTIFPLPLAEAASWDLDAIKLSAKIAAKEAASGGIQWTFAPMMDVSRDARWGRVMEGAGEDPYYGGLVAEARVKGFQGDDLSNVETIAACAKHFAGYGLSESGKDYNTVSVGKYDLYNYILPPFQKAVEAKAATFMNSFNDLDGIPSTSNKWLVNDLLRETWKFEGLIVSDWNSIGELINHGVAGDLSEAGKLALTAGTDIDMESNAYIDNIEHLVENNEIPMSAVDNAVRRILTLKANLGLLDDPYKYFDAEREKKTLLAPEHLEAARDVARKSIVLLKNEGGLLPLKTDVKSIAIIGPLAKDKDAPIGNWRGLGESNSAVSFYEGMKEALGKDVKINYAQGCKLSIGENAFHIPLTIEENDRSGFAAAIAAARASKIVFMVLGEPAHMSGEARSKVNIGLPGLQLELLKAVYKVNKNIVLILQNGRPLTIPWEAENISTILETWHLGSNHGHAVADVVTGVYNPSGKLPMSFPRHVGQLPIYYNKRITGRPESDLIFKEQHMDVDRTPQYAFGFGLSYTSFEFSDPELTSEGQTVTVRSTLTNTGKVTGKETIQCYIQAACNQIAFVFVDILLEWE